MRCDAAHTSPVYIYRGGKPIPANATCVRMLLDRVDRLLAALTASDTGGKMQAESIELRDKTLKYCREAREFYVSKLARVEKGVR